MSIEDFWAVESSEGASGSAEISEKYKEAAKKAGAWIKRTQKDESKAKKYDFLLAKFLVEIILKKKYDTILDELFACLDAGYGTNFLLGILSLIYFPISQEIRRHAGKEDIDFHYEVPGESIEFDDHALPPEVRKRVNAWIEDMELVITMESSTLITKRTLGLILYDEKIRIFTSKVFAFFFTELKITINDVKARSYSDFILWELQKSTRNLLPEMIAKDDWEEGEI